MVEAVPQWNNHGLERRIISSSKRYWSFAANRRSLDSSDARLRRTPSSLGMTAQFWRRANGSTDESADKSSQE